MYVCARAYVCKFVWGRKKHRDEWNGRRKYVHNKDILFNNIIQFYFYSINQKNSLQINK